MSEVDITEVIFEINPEVPRQIIFINPKTEQKGENEPKNEQLTRAEEVIKGHLEELSEVMEAKSESEDFSINTLVLEEGTALAASDTGLKVPKEISFEKQKPEKKRQNRKKEQMNPENVDNKTKHNDAERKEIDALYKELIENPIKFHRKYQGEKKTTGEKENGQNKKSRKKGEEPTM